MAKFSSRYDFDPRIPKQAILGDAPEGMRAAYVNTILRQVVSYGHDEDTRPLYAWNLSNEFCGMARQEMPPFPSRSSQWDDLKSLLRDAKWFNFYDFVEHVGKELKRIEQSGSHVAVWIDDYAFASYKSKVNQLFMEDRIGWRLNENSELVRDIPGSLSRRLVSTAAELRGSFEPARKHYYKAVRFVSERPLDPENAIKEITSAVESVGKVFYPDSKTLGDVTSEMRKKASFPPLLTSLVEKFYAYASSEPAIRHGSAQSSRVRLADAEFCLHVGVALIRYLLEVNDSSQRNPAASSLGGP